MLTLTNSLRAAGLVIYQDEGNDLAATPKRVVGFYVLPDAPRIAADEKGRPKVSLLLYRGGGPDGKSGGRLMFAAALTPPDDRMQAAAADLRKQIGQDAPLSAVPFTDGLMALSMPGESQDGEFVQAQLAGAPFHVDGPEVTIAVELSMEGAVMVRQGATGALPLRLGLELGFELRPTGVAIKSACDGAAAYAKLCALADSPNPPIVRGQAPAEQAIPQLAEALQESLGVTISVAPLSSTIDDDSVITYSRLAQDEVVRRLGAFLTATPLPAAAAPAFSDALAAALTFTLDATTPVRQQARLSSRFAPGGDPSSWIREIDLDDALFKKPTP